MHKSRDKAGVQAGLAKLKDDWQALPPNVQQEIQEKHQKLFERLRMHLSGRQKMGAPEATSPDEN